MIDLIHQYEFNEDWVLQPHTHESVEMTLISSGSGILFSPNGQSIPLTKGSLLLIPDSASHGCIATEPLSMSVVCFFNKELTSFNKLVYEMLFASESREIKCIELNKTHLEEYKYYFTKLNEEFFCNGHLKEDALRIQMEALLLLVSRNLNRSTSMKSDLHHAIMSSAREIESNYSSDMKIEELASKFFISGSYFRKMFKDIFGLSPKQYLINVRLTEAKRLMAHTSKNITSIATEVGFPTVHQFIVAFTEKEGKTPTDWRRQCCT